ncbi:MAG: DNA-processing protein DprA [Lachnospiraceae bacterium]
MECTRLETAYGAYLQSLSGVGDKTLRYLYEQFGGLEYLKAASDSTCERLMGKKFYTVWKEVRGKSPEEYLEKLERKGIRYIHNKDKLFPDKLREIPDSPFGIYVIGSLPDPNKPAVAMVGARASSLYGQAVATRFATAFAHAGIQTISGMARGIDSISHKETLGARGTTFAVLGSGVDVCYPPELHQLYGDIKNSGGVISTYPPGMSPLSRNFPARNRIISGLSDVLLVIEAKEKSGTLITVDMALEQGKDVYAVPGKITDALSSGCNKLIAQGASVAIDAEQIIEDVMGICYKQKLGFVQTKIPLSILDQDAEIAINVLSENTMQIEHWYARYKERKGQRSFSQFLSLVTQLEVDCVVYAKEGLYTFRMLNT